MKPTNCGYCNTEFLPGEQMFKAGKTFVCEKCLEHLFNKFIAEGPEAADARKVGKK